MKRRPWGTDELEQVRRMRCEQGMSCPKISYAIGRSENSVKAKCAQLGWYMPSGKNSKYGPVWKKEELDEVQRLRSTLGLSYSEIATRINDAFGISRTPAAVKYRCCFFKWHLPPEIKSRNLRRGKRKGAM
jgi:hypothetical protein